MKLSSGTHSLRPRVGSLPSAAGCCGSDLCLQDREEAVDPVKFEQVVQRSVDDVIQLPE